MRVLSTGLAALLGLALASTASAQFSTQNPTKVTKGSVAASPKGPGAPSTANPNATGGIIALSTNDCTSPTPISGPGSAGFDTSAATTSGFNGGGTCATGASSINQDLFWQWTATTAGTIEFNTFGSSFDTKLSVHAGVGCAATCVAYNDDTAGLQSQVFVPGVNIGDTFVIQVGGFGSSFGAGVLNYDVQPPVPPANDDCSTPTVIAGAGPHAFDNAGATTGAEGQTEGLCYAFGTSAIDNDAWFTWTAPSTAGFIVSTCAQTTVDTKIAVYPGAGCPTNGTSIACNDDACGLQSTLSFNGVAGNTYTIQIGTFPGASGGTGTFTIGSFTPGTGSDNCATAPAISGTGNFGFDVSSATTGAEGQNEANCYAFGTSGIDTDVWFAWTSNCTGMVNVTTCGGAGFDTKLAAYPGGGCPTDGSSLACNDDACGLQSSIDFAASAGSTYMLQIGTFPGTGSTPGPGTIAISCSGPTGPGIEFCNGDGSGTLCPCGNQNDGSNGVSGCANSAGAGGGKLAGTGTNSIGAGDLVLNGSTLQPGQAGLYLQGNNAVSGGNGLAFGDGLRCAGGGVVRLQVRNSGMAGASFTTVNIASVGGVSPGDIRRYQLWFRDTAGPCGSGFNFTNGLEVTWAP